MRRRLYYTDKQITKNLYTTGSEWQTEDGVEYIGSYHTYITSETYTQSDWNEATSKKLVKYEQANQNVVQYQKLKNIALKFETPQSSIVRITNQDRLNGFITKISWYVAFFCRGSKCHAVLCNGAKTQL